MHHNFCHPPADQGISDTSPSWLKNTAASPERASYTGCNFTCIASYRKRPSSLLSFSSLICLSLDCV